MNKNFILEYVKNKIDSSKEKNDLLRQIEDARLELEWAWEVFNYVNDPKLIEVAIFSEQAARTRYEFLISEAKRFGIKSDTTLNLRVCK
ncbi:YaaL family protein [Clostridium folliculivorans]|uniref:DUF2508 domain-containing protein n=1 Tax=Clostridium folliculivorans TaxID=2886038 RepID=A0A9W5Y6C4_9CLOT|nr:YaaL family protein [Clostridium folliculivorans]GKU27379.1 hypothetical protein CFOLD11_42060 [Clostridium folliculivorans]GKU32230.1 hypothetical protein CFB3_43380 [Clostridium folliculivorans]